MRNLFGIMVAICATLSPAFAAKQYSYFRVGNANDVTTATTPGTVLMGGGTAAAQRRHSGGTDVDAAFQRMCGRSSNGDLLVIRATGTDAYNPYIQRLCPNENSVATLIIPNRTAASGKIRLSIKRKISRGGFGAASEVRDLPKGKGRPCFHDRPLFMPATTYAPTHFRVQYHRPCGA